MNFLYIHSLSSIEDNKDVENLFIVKPGQGNKIDIYRLFNTTLISLEVVKLKLFRFDLINESWYIHLKVFQSKISECSINEAL
jgi:hypothetical protein